MPPGFRLSIAVWIDFFYLCRIEEGKMKNFVEELRWRGMLHDITPGTEEQLLKEPTSGYIGFDPTADSLHIGHLAQIMTLLNFQVAGHKPFALVGGATGMVGDPSGKSAERNLLSEDVLRHNVACVKEQLEKFLDFFRIECGGNGQQLRLVQGLQVPGFHPGRW